MTSNKSVISWASTNPISFFSDVSGMDEESEGPVEMVSMMFYNTVKREREKLLAKTGGKKVSAGKNLKKYWTISTLIL